MCLQECARAMIRRFGVAFVMLLLAAVALPDAGRAASEIVTVLSFNVESDRDTNPRKVAEDIASISADVDLVGLVEVFDEKDAKTYSDAVERPGNQFRYLMGRHGNEDSMAILYNLNTLKFKEVYELDRFPGSRKALVGRFRHKKAGLEFLFIVNHFNRGDIKRRQRQSELIRDWVLSQKLPAILVGDYNFDFNPDTMQGNQAFDIFTAKKGISWVRPECLSDNSCPLTGTQCDGRYNSIMDFVFLADQERGWQGLSEVLLKRPDYCARERRGYADHRPVLGVIAIK